MSSLDAAHLLRRQFEVMDQLFGHESVDNRPFQILSDVPLDSDKRHVYYEGYIGIGGGVPDYLEVRRRGDNWFYVLAPELMSPDLALIIGTTTPLREA